MTIAPEKLVSLLVPQNPAPDLGHVEIRYQILAKRNAGATIPELAKEFGLAINTVRAHIKKVYRELASETAEDMSARQRGIMLDLTRANYPAALAGDKDAAVVIMRCLDHEARLYGLFAPARVAVGITGEQFADRASELLAAMDVKAISHTAGRDYVDAEVVTEVSGNAEVVADNGGQAATESVAAGGWANL